ncbi:hypothetical protein Tco_0459061 [Tanacetum coccineum]
MVAYLLKLKEFWQTASTITLEDGEVEITATIDGQLNTITEASLRRHLKLEDADVPVESHLISINTPSKSEFPTQTQVAYEAAFTSVDVDAGGAATTDIGLEAGQGSGTIHKTPTRTHGSPLPRVHILGSDKGSLQQNKLMDLVTKLTYRVKVLENDMQQTKKVYSSALTKLILRVKRLEKKVKTIKARRRAKIVISEDKDAKEDSSKQGRKISDIDKDPTISLVYPEQDMEYDFDVSTTKVFTTASVPVTTASVTPEVSTATANLVARQEQEVVAEADQAHDIDWSDPAVLRYHALQNRSFSVTEVRKNMCMYLKNQGGYKLSHFKGMSYEDIRRIFERVWDQNNAFVPKDSEIEKEVMKRPGFNFQQKSSKKRSREDSDEDNAKKQKLEDDVEKKELRDSMDVVPRDDIYIDSEADGSSKNYKIFSEMLDDFDRQDVLDLHRLVQERTSIHMMIEKKYPLTQEMLSRMLSRRLEVDQESEMAFELLRFIRSQLHQ